MANTEALSDEYGKYPNRWTQLWLGVFCMALIANLQYGWTLFVAPIESKYGWARTAIQLSFAIFIVVETWLVPIEGWLVDKFGPKPVVIGGAILGALGWIINAYADTIPMLYVGQIVAGMGAGAVYGTCVGNAVKWFPDRRGLAAGFTAAGFGAGAAVTVIPIASMINSSGYEKAFIVFGIIQSALIIVAAFFFNNHPRPPKGIKAVGRVVTAKYGKTMGEMAKTPVFWLIYVCFVGVASGGLMATAQLGPLAKDYGLSKIPVELLGVTLPLLTMAMSVDNICNGFTRPLFGLVSDRIGRENTMLIVFTGEALALLGMMKWGHDPYGFMLFAALIFLFWGEIFSLFPAMCADTFGNKFAAGNAGALYTAKGTAGILVPFTSVLSAGGNWDRVFMLSAAIAFSCACLAFFVLKPMRANYIRVNNEAFEAEKAKAA